MICPNSELLIFCSLQIERSIALMLELLLVDQLERVARTDLHDAGIALDLCEV